MQLHFYMYNQRQQHSSLSHQNSEFRIHHLQKTRKGMLDQCLGVSDACVFAIRGSMELTAFVLAPEFRSLASLAEAGEPFNLRPTGISTSNLVSHPLD